MAQWRVQAYFVGELLKDWIRNNKIQKGYKEQCKFEDFAYFSVGPSDGDNEFSFHEHFPTGKRTN